MKNFLTVVFFIASAFIGFSQTKNFIDHPYLETTAKVDSLVQPDRIYLSILIQEKEDRNKTTVETQEQLLAEVLENLNIDLKKQLRIEDLASNYKKYFLRKKSVLKSKAYELVVYDGLTASNVLIHLEAKGISNVQLTKTKYSKTEALKMALRSKAILKAKAQATALVTPLEQSLGKAIFISEKYYNNSYNLRNGLVKMAYSAEMKLEEPLDIEFSGIKIESEVTVRFSIN
ncbi:MAG: SIMPL domain-containing protein [Flavobacteriaceae bacterium]